MPWQSPFLHGDDDALAPHDAHILALCNLAAVCRDSLPVVAVDCHAAVSVGLYRLAHPATPANQGIGVALAPLVAAVELFQHHRADEEQAEHRQHRENDQLPQERHSR